MKNISFGVCLLLVPLVSPIVHSQELNPAVANAYNDGVVRCGNAECAKYLYECFRAYSDSMQDFIACGSLASRLNDNQEVVGG